MWVDVQWRSDSNSGLEFDRVGVCHSESGYYFSVAARHSESDGYLVLTTQAGVHMELHFFDPNETVSIIERKLPHWSQAGAVTFITFRTHDSMPQDVVERWRNDRWQWLRQHGINPRNPAWREELSGLARPLQNEFFSTFSQRWHDELDRCHGACVLSDPVNAKTVADSLLKFDGTRYVLTDFIVMPNHVHLLAAFEDEDAMLTQCESWKRFTGRRINCHIVAQGRFWQQDGFDHLVRSMAQFEHFRKYIATNPDKAGLVRGDVVHYSAEDSSKSPSLSE